MPCEESSSRRDLISERDLYFSLSLSVSVEYNETINPKVHRSDIKTKLRNFKCPEIFKQSIITIATTLNGASLK